MAPTRRPSALPLAVAAAVLVTGCAAPAAQAPAPASQLAVLPSDFEARARRGAPMHGITLNRATALRTGGPFQVVGSTVTLGPAVRDVIVQPSGFDMLLAVDGRTYLVADILRPEAVADAAGYRVRQAAPVRVVGNALDNRMWLGWDVLTQRLAVLRQEMERMNREGREAELELNGLKDKQRKAQQVIDSVVLALPGAIAKAIIDKQVAEVEGKLVHLRAHYGEIKRDMDRIETDLGRLQVIEANGGREAFDLLRSLGEAEVRRRAAAACTQWERDRGLLAMSREEAEERRWPVSESLVAQYEAREAASRAEMVTWTTHEKRFNELRARGLLQTPATAFNAGYTGGVRRAIEFDGGDGADYLVAAAGVFRDGGALVGGAGNDVIVSFAPGGRLAGEGGDDTVIGSAGADVLEGGDGNDVLVGRAGSDRLMGGDGDDRLFGDGGSDTLDGDAGVDQLVGGDGHDTLRGAAGDDVAFGGAGDDTVEGGDGLDRLEGGSGYDTLSGGAGADALSGGDGDDALDGGDGDDALEGGTGLDRLSGAAGADGLYLEYAGEASETVGGDRTTTGPAAGSLDGAGLSADWRVANRWFGERRAVEEALLAESARYAAAADELLP
jgi:hypothetical protein